MLLKSSKLKISGDVWNGNKRYKVNAIVLHNSVTYQNTTGINSEPSLASTDWAVVDKEISESPIVTVNGNKFFLIKHPNNVNPLETSNIEDNDFISAGFWDATTYWPQAQCTDATDINNINSWMTPTPIEELTLI